MLLGRAPGRVAAATAAAASVAAVVAGIAAARTVSTGDHSRFTRDGATAARTGYWASNMGANDEVRIIVYPHRKVRVGDRFDLIGRSEALGRVEVVEATETTDNCPRYAYLTVKARLIEGKLDQSWGQMVAVMPASKGHLKGKAVMANYDVTDSTGLPPAGSAPSMVFAVDTDGDDEWDLVRYMYTCADGVSGARYTGAGEGCVEDWNRDRGQWRQVSLTRVLCR